MVQAASGCADDGVLGGHRDVHQFCASPIIGCQPEPVELVQPQGDGTLHGRRRRQPGSERYATLQGHVETGALVPGVVESPHHTGGVGGPPLDLAPQDLLERALPGDDLTVHSGTDADDIVVPAAHRSIGGMWQGDGQTETTVVVGVFPDEVDPSWTGPHAVRGGCVLLGEQVGSLASSLPTTPCRLGTR